MDKIRSDQIRSDQEIGPEHTGVSTSLPPGKISGGYSSSFRPASDRCGSSVDVGPRVVRAGAESARRVRWRRESVVREVSAMRGMLEVGLVGSGRDERRQWRSVILGVAGE